MTKKAIPLDPEGNESHGAALAKIKNSLGNQCACCILITCSESATDGKMQVEMSFEGEESLAAFLIENASQIFDERIAKREVKESPPTPYGA